MGTKVLSFNVRQWSRDLNKKKVGFWRDRAKMIRSLIALANPDIILFQELTYPMTSCIPDGYKKATGCSISHHIYCRKEYKVRSHKWHMRWCKALIDTPNRSVNVFCVHTHWNEDIYRKTCTEITSNLEGGIPNIAGGDWNNYPEVIKPLVDPMSIINTGIPTHRNWETNKESELDFFAVWPEMGEVATLSDFGCYSDHKPVILTI